MKYLLEHTVLWNGEFTWILALGILVLAGVCVYCFVRLTRMKKELREIEKQLKNKE